MMAGSGREIPKGKLSLIVTAHHPVKEGLNGVVAFTVNG